MIAEANRLPYGLAAYAWTGDAKRQRRLAREIESRHGRHQHHDDRRRGFAVRRRQMVGPWQRGRARGRDLPAWSPRRCTKARAHDTRTQDRRRPRLSADRDRRSLRHPGADRRHHAAGEGRPRRQGHDVALGLLRHQSRPSARPSSASGCSTSASCASRRWTTPGIDKAILALTSPGRAVDARRRRSQGASRARQRPAARTPARHIPTASTA